MLQFHSNLLCSLIAVREIASREAVAAGVARAQFNPPLYVVQSSAVRSAHESIRNGTRYAFFSRFYHHIESSSEDRL